MTNYETSRGRTSARRLLFQILLCLSSVSLVLPAYATSEGVLLPSTFGLASPGIGESGPVKISGSHNASGLSSLIVEAFGRKYVLSSAQLKLLAGHSINGVAMSYARGPSSLGGRQLYVLLSKVFTSGTAEMISVTFTEKGSISIGISPQQ
jgi:hypothetical protein